MNRRQILLCCTAACILIINNGCMPQFDKETYETAMSAMKQTQLRMKVYGHPLEDKQLSRSYELQEKAFLSDPNEFMRHSPDGSKVIVDAHTHTVVNLTDISQNEFLRNQTRQMDRFSKTFEMPGIDMAEINREEMLNKAISVSVSHSYPEYQGLQSRTMLIFLPGRPEVRECEYKPGISLLGSFKMKAEWHTVLNDPYAALYPSFVSGSFMTPEITDFENRAAKWTFHSTMKDVWSSIMHVTSQYHGILAITDANDHKVLICRRVFPILSEEKQPLFEAILLAVAVVGEGENLTTIYCAPLEPDGTLKNLTERSILSLPQKELGSDSINLSSYLMGADIANNKLLSYLKPDSNIRSNTGKENYGEISSARRRAIYVHRFFQELGIQLFGPRLWAQKFTSIPGTIVAQSSSPSPRFSKMKKIPEKYEAATTYVGQEITDTLAVTQVQIVDPNLQRVADDIANRLILISERLVPNMPSKELVGPVRVRIIASPDVQAFALPNGEIFVCSGLLDTLDNSGELAAVFAHEFSHVVCQDAAGQLLKQAETRKTVETVGQVTSIGLSAVAPIMAASSAAAGSSASYGFQMSLSATTGAISGLSGSAAQAFAVAAMEGYSQEAELRADEFAVTSLTGAGYDSQGMLNLLETLQIKDQEKGNKQGLVQQQRVQSSLINAKPGLKDRIAHVRSLIAKEKQSL